ncbi:26S proteasome non-ATPase regulatory subunit 2 1A [Acorus calamus]|uniref:26S proteasome non-ATPase regulatory subunit 2 1A n=1 Tax=Acorus calamus TaxID=4465 RepID=A0AAV9E0R0_ACOCL|nr:26S proteasome non-ATPase regulatory subunit 2 1A [Acorus calamus]
MAVDTNPNSTSPDPSKAPLKDQKKKKHAKKEEDLKKFADILSVLAMTMDMGEQESLKYKLLGTTEDIGSWGHEYVRYTFPGVDDITALRTAYTIYLNFKDYTSSLRVALFFEDIQGMVLELDDEMAEEDEDRKALQDIINNCKLSEGYLSVARDLEDKFMTVPSEFSSGSSSGDWIFKNKEHGKASAVASLGMISLWDIDSGLAQIDNCLYSDDNQIVAGALLAVGIVTCGIKNEYEPALALLHGFTNKGDTTIRIGAIMGLGIAYAGSRKVELGISLDQILCDATTPVEVLAFTAISLGLVFVGSCNEMLEQTFINLLKKHREDALNDSLIRFLPVALGLLFLGKEDYSKATSDYLHIFNEKIRRFCDVILRSLAFAGTGDVDQIQVLQRYCAEDIVKNELHQGPAVLGIALVGMAEEVGIDMAIRALEHFLQYGGQNIRRAVPLALGLLCISNPKMNVRDTLSRLSHDSDGEVSMAAIISLGLIGAGTNNGRIAKMLRDLIRYYDGEAKHLFCPRMLLTVDENLKPIPVLVRVGKAVDVVAQAGRPRTVTGFQTFTTPVILGAGERAELATEK